LKNLTEGKEGKLILQFAIPMLIGNVFQQLYNVVDSMVVGNYLGKEALSAVGASFPVFFALISLVIGISSGAGIVISQYFGAKRNDRVQQGSDTMFLILFGAAGLVTIPGIIFAEDIFRLIDLPENIIPEAVIYLRINLAGLITAFGYNGVAAVFRSLGDSKTPLYFLIISTIINIFLDLLFVAYFKMGIEGVAYATVISQTGAFLTGVIWLNRTHDFLRINFLKLKFNKIIFIKSVKIGLPSGMQTLFVSLGMVAIFKLVNGFGTDVIAAYSVALRIDSFAIMPAMNFSMALSAFAGQNIGAKKYDRVKRGLRSTLFMSTSVALTISLVVIFFGDVFMGWFTPENVIIGIGHEYLQIVGAFYIVFASMFTIMSVFRGAGDTVVPMFITLIALWGIRIPLSWYLAIDYGELGIWYSIPLGWVFGLIASTAYYFTGRWKRIKVVD